MSTDKEWFVSWFNTPFYHILYKHRDDTEAKEFIQHLTAFLHLKKGNSILDLACGKGRHSVYLNSLGFNVIGADLSKNSIAHAKQFENKTLSFEVHDMRHSFETKFDVILNLFTSFGFFKEDKEDIKVLQNIKKGLKSNGLAVIDFMNAKKVIKNLVQEEVQLIDGIKFKIKRYLDSGFIVKEINFNFNGEQHTYYERVKILTIDKINEYVNKVNFKIKHTFGNYQLNSFNEETSDRLILVLE